MLGEVLTVPSCYSESHCALCCISSSAHVGRLREHIHPSSTWRLSPDSNTSDSFKDAWRGCVGDEGEELEWQLVYATQEQTEALSPNCECLLYGINVSSRDTKRLHPSLTKSLQQEQQANTALIWLLQPVATIHDFRDEKTENVNCGASRVLSPTQVPRSQVIDRVPR